jgi:hypothetical protein
MPGIGQRDPPHCPHSRFHARVYEFAFSARGQTGAISLLTLIIVLLAPLVILGGLAFVLVLAYANRVSQITAKTDSSPKPTVCPACGHKLVEIRKFCAECGASIWPPEGESPGEPNAGAGEPSSPSFS